MIGRLISALRWLAGCEAAARKPDFDDLEPYCDEKTLQQRKPAMLDRGEARAMHKIGARYGAEL
jgi:hypothetical protein